MRKQISKIRIWLNRKRVLFLLLIFSMALLGSAVYRFAAQNKRLEEVYAKLEEQMKLKEKLENLDLFIKTAESANRGYAITGNKLFVENFEPTIDSIQTNNLQLQKFYSQMKNKTATALFWKSDSLIRKKIIHMQRIKKLCDENNHTVALALISGGEGLKLSDSIAKINTQINERFQSKLKQLKTDFYQSRAKNNQLAYFSIAASMLFILFVIFLLIIEVRRTKKISEELKVQKENYRIILNCLGEGLITTDTTGRIDYMNPTAEQLTGWNWREAKKEPLHQVFNVTNEETGKTYMDVVSRILHDKKKIEWENSTILKAKNAGTFIIRNSGAPIFDIDGNAAGAVLVFNDITEEDKTKKALLQSEINLRAVFENSSKGFLLIDNNYTVIEVNSLMKKFTAITLGRAYKKNDNLLHILPINRKERLEKNFEKILLGESVDYETTYPMDNGTTISFHVNMNPVKDSKGEVRGSCITVEDITERKRTRELIENQEYRLRSLIDSAPDATVIVNEKGIIEITNQQAVKLLGYSKEELIGMSVEKLIPSSRQETHKDYRLNYLKNPDVRSMDIGKELVVVNKDGLVIPVEISLAPFISEDETLVTASIRDITERKKAEKEARDFKYALDESSLITIADPEGTILYTNDNFCRISQYTAQELIGKKHRIVNSGYHTDSFFKNMWTTVANSKIWRGEVRNKAKDGSIFWMDTTIVPFMNGGEKPNRYIAIRHDITERKKAEEALAESENQLRTVIEVEPECVDLLNIHCELEDMNKAGLEMIEADNLMQVKGKSVLDIINEPYRQAFLHLSENVFKGKSAKLEFEITGLKGTKRWMETHAVPLKNVEGKIISQLSVTRDITERKKAEELLQKANEDFRRLATHLEEVREEERIGIAREIHDTLGQQLTIFKMDLSWLKNKAAAKDEKTQQKMDELTAMVENMITTVRKISSELRPVMLDDLGLITALEWQCHEFEKRTGIKTKFVAEAEDLDLPSNVSTGVFKIFQESLTNIIRHANAKLVNVLLTFENGKLIMTVSDNGKGFIQEVIENKKTLGILGMRERTKLIGGEYNINSTPGKGTTVKVSVPAGSAI